MIYKRSEETERILKDVYQCIDDNGGIAKKEQLAALGIDYRRILDFVENNDVIRIKNNKGEVYSYYLVWIEKAYGTNTIFRGYDFAHDTSCVVTLLSQDESTIQYKCTDSILSYNYMDKNVSKENGTGLFRCNDTIANIIAALSYWVPLLCILKTEA